MDAQGLAGFNTNAVAELAGISVGSLYQYFPNKQALLAELIRLDDCNFIRALDAAASNKDCVDVKTRIRALIEVAVAHQFNQPQLVRIIDIQEQRLPLEHEEQEKTIAISRILSNIFLDSGLEPRQIPQAALDLIGIVQGMVDTAAKKFDQDTATLPDRVYKAVIGYLNLEL